MRHWLTPLLWAMLIYIGSSVPGREIPGTVGAVSRLLHIAEYAVFGALVCRAVRQSLPWKLSGHRALIEFTVSVFYGMTDEIHQAFVTGRNADGMDLVADAVGGLLGMALLMIWRKQKNVV